jgi:hypothetical protein
MIGRDVTFSGLAKITGAGYIVPRFSGAGVTANSSFFRLEFGEGWGIVTGTCRILSAGNLKVGWYIPNATSSTHIYLDDCCVSVGQKTPINPSKFESIDIGGKTWIVASAAPTTGTWPVGAIAWNSAPTAGGGGSPFIGWVCVTAGTPGTWKTFGAVTA